MMKRYALIDKTGKTRGTCQAKNAKEAVFAIRGPGKTLPEGWHIVVRGPGTAPARLSPAAFKVGDSIRILAPHWAVKEGVCPAGTVANLVVQTDDNPVMFLLDIQYKSSKTPVQFTPGDYTTNEVEHLPAADSAPKPCPLDPQAEKLLEEAREALAEAKRKQDHTDALLVKALDERDTATREARALNATVDNLTANLSRANTEINRLNAMLAKAQEARDAHRKALGLAEQDGTILDAIEHLQRVGERRRQGLERLREFFEAHGVVDLDETFANFVQVDGRAREFGRLTRAEVDRLRREVESLHENVAQAKRERDLALTKRDEALAQVKDMEECPTEILGFSIFTRRGNRIHLHYNLTEQGESMTRSEFTALASAVSAHAADLIHELTGNGEA